ncbi:unnamed protein product [marine sediment metagenome]|uniref:Uncharacterized protein n=1 Tax=marine sediment metagenome TaxID=412755 RepID=X1Q7C1_9ZZZZ
MEFQHGGWAHYHLCIELTPEFAARLARAYKHQGGRGIVEINNSVVGPLWGHGFTYTRESTDPVRAAIYAASYSVKGGKEHQRRLPPWYDEWCRVTDRKRMTKWSRSRGFFDKENDVERKAPKPPPRPRPERCQRVQRATKIVLKECGVRETLVVLEVQCTRIDEKTGEYSEDGWYRKALGRVDEPVSDVVESLRRNGVDVYADDDGSFSLWPNALHAIRRLIHANWFGWHHLKTLGAPRNAREL